MNANQQLRSTFDSAALFYDEARPGYPEQLFDDIVDLSGIHPGGRVLEIGCGTGKATLPMARRCYRLHCVELGENLAAVARKNLEDYPDCSVNVGAFEDWPIEPEEFDLALSATAWHWIEQPSGYQKLAQALKPGGAIAIFRHHHVHGAKGAAFFEAVQKIYDVEKPPLEKDLELPHPDEIPDWSEEIDQTGLFGPVTTRRYVSDHEYDAANYINLLNTFSDHIRTPEPNRERLYRGISELINRRFGGRIVKTTLVILHLAHKRS